MIPEDGLRGVVARCAGDAAAGMRPGTTMIQTLQRSPIAGIPKHWACREQLVERKRAMEDVAIQEAKLAFEVEGRHDLASNHAGSETWRIAVDRGDHQIGNLLAMVIPRSAFG